MGGKRDDVPRKIFSKQNKCIKYINEETKLNIGVTPAKNIVICNSGLALGLSQEDVIVTFGALASIEQIVMLPKKTYCFVSFKDIATAAEVLASLHGRAKLPSSDSLLVLAFSDKVPDAPCQWGSTLPPGLILLESFVTEEEERRLLNCLHWDDTCVGSALKHRQVQHFGYEFRYSGNDVDTSAPLEKRIPTECDFLEARLAKRGYSTWGFQPNQLTVNRYQPGQGIPPHVDTHSMFNDPILSLSLMSDVVMEFKDCSGNHIPVVLPRCSLLIMSGESRYGWTHGITPRTSDVVPASGNRGLTVIPRNERVSFTFRRVRFRRECFCNYPALCDHQKEKLYTEQKDAVSLEHLYVHKVYEQISDHFSATRHKAWPNVLDFVRSLKMGSVLVDVGCGNGKYFGHHTKQNPIFELGCDASQALANLCAERGFEVLNCNCLALPYRAGIADGCICIAVIHHLSTWERRRKAIQEIVRILRPGGRGLVYVWARNQQQDHVLSAYLKQDRKNRRIETNADKITPSEAMTCECPPAELPISVNDYAGILPKLPLPIHASRTEFKHVDVLVPWKIKPEYVKSESCTSRNVDSEQTLLRFYHVFEEGELERLCSEVPQIQILQVGYEQGNWIVMFKKLP